MQCGNRLAEVQPLSENSHQSSVQESSGISPLGIQAPTKSLSVSLSETRNLLSELSEFLNNQKQFHLLKTKLLYFNKDMTTDITYIMRCMLHGCAKSILNIYLMI